MSVSRNNWSKNEIDILHATMNDGLHRGHKPYVSAKLAASQLHRSAESCLLKWKYDTDPEFRRRNRTKKVNEPVVTEDVQLPLYANSDNNEVRITFKEIKIDPVTKELIVFI